MWEYIGHEVFSFVWPPEWPSFRSGCRCISRTTPLSMKTLWLQLRGRLTSLVATFGLPARFANQDAEATKAVADLCAKGAVITDDLQIKFEPQAQVLYEQSPFAADTGAQDLPRNREDFNAAAFHGTGLLSRVSRVLAAVRAARLHAAAESPHQIALLLASGETVGQFWSHTPVHRREAFENLWFRTSLRQRLNVSITSSGLRCQLCKAERSQEHCLEELTERHVYCCQTGMARFRPHRNVLITLADALRDLGAYVDIERYCADLLSQHSDGESREAWLDICAHFPGHVHLWRLDVTVRSTWAQGNRANRCPALAADAGVSAKARRYGEAVTAVAMEPLGRVAVKSCEALWDMAKQARDKRLTQCAPRQGYRKLRLCLERALLWSMAERLIAASGHT